MASLLVGGALLFASLSEARNCMNVTTPVNISARTALFNTSIAALPNTQVDIPMMVLNVVSNGHNFSEMALTGYETTTGTYNISGTFCQPDNSTANSTGSGQYLQVLSHDYGWDRSYWDLAFNNSQYSYVNSALAAGYCTFAYDRLGIGNSSHGDPLNEIQASTELAALTSLTQQLSDGSVPGVNQSFDDRIIHVGHGAGSEQSMALAAQNPNMTSGLVLTGWSSNTSFQNMALLAAGFQDAAHNQPIRLGDMNATTLQTDLQFQVGGQSIMTNYAPISFDASDIEPGLNYTPGYVVWAHASNLETMYTKAPNFDPSLFNYLEQNVKQPTTYGDLLSQVNVNSSSFDGPVLVITGENDLPYCGGDCLGTGDAEGSVLDGVKDIFSSSGNSSNVETYLQPTTGNALNIHLNSTGAYSVITSFLQKNNLS